MFTDIVGSTEMTARLGDVLATEVVRAHDSIVRRSLHHCGGREVKHTGDGIMASFDKPVVAVNCAKSILNALAEYNAGASEPIHIRIGLDSGEPVTDSNDLFGSTVQMAARLCAAARPDQILMSENVWREHPRRELFKRNKKRRLKGFPESVSTFELMSRS